MEVTMFGRLQLYIFIGILVFASLTAGYYSWRNGIEREALLEYNQKQIEQDLKDKDILRQQLEDINAKKKEIEAENAEVKKKFKESMDTIVVEINTSEAKPASKVLKDTVNKLKDVVK
jgi:stress response protein YsnF